MSQPKFAQNDISKRTIAVVDTLIRKQILSNDADFCRQLDFAPQTWSHIRKGKRNVPTMLISKISTTFEVSPDFIYFGKGPQLTDESLEYTSQVSEPSSPYFEASLKAENERLTKLLDAQIDNAQLNIKYRKLLEQRIKELEAELSQLQKGKKVN